MARHKRNSPLYKTIKAVFILLLFVALAVVVTMAIPVTTWRTGEVDVRPLSLEAGKSSDETPVRIWVDTDAACGQDQQTDPDDCLAILLLARSNQIEIAGMSSVFGNAAIDVTDATARALAQRLVENGYPPVPVSRGAGKALDSQPFTQLLPGQRALQQALEQGPVRIMALGPLTNVAISLKDRPDLQRNVVEIVAVMGRRPGHLFHPVEGGTAGSFFGHGPIFRDFNFTKDPEAAAELLAMRVPLTLVPYEAARNASVGSDILYRMISNGGVEGWVAERCLQWLSYWKREINRDGFYPFDLVAAAYLVEPPLLQCAPVSIAIGRDVGLFGLFGIEGVFVIANDRPRDEFSMTGRAKYCPGVREDINTWLRMKLTVGQFGNSAGAA